MVSPGKVERIRYGADRLAKGRWCLANGLGAEDSVLKLSENTRKYKENQTQNCVVELSSCSYCLNIYIHIVPSLFRIMSILFQCHPIRFPSWQKLLPCNKFVKFCQHSQDRTCKISLSTPITSHPFPSRKEDVGNNEKTKIPLIRKRSRCLKSQKD